METAAINKDYAMLPAPFQERANVMGCPASGETLHLEAGVFESSSGRRYPIEDGIPNFFVSVDPSMSDRDVIDVVQGVLRGDAVSKL